MNVVELKQLIDDNDGIGYCIENNLIDVSLLANTTLADMIADAKELIDEVNRLMDAIIEELKSDCSDDCDCDRIE